MDFRKRILIVDDESSVRESCARIFGDRGYEVETAASGREGIDRARHGYFDCALVDLKMPDMNGMEIVRQARTSRGNMAILIVTGYGSVETAAEAARLGVSDYVCKPFTPDEIAQAVDRAVQTRPGTAVSETLSAVAKDLREHAPRAEHFEHRTPKAIAQMVTNDVGVKKARGPVATTIVLGVLAGAYIGFGAALATLVGHDAASRFGLGVGQMLVGAAFSVGLMLVVVAGAELFTGNNLMIACVLGKECGPSCVLSRWSVVYAANFVGAVLLALIMHQTGLWKVASYAVGAKAVAIANVKVNLSFGEAFFRGVGCNWLVCLAVWMALSAKEIAGKVLAIFFPIMAFVALGFEHCVANMYFIPMGLFLKGTVAAPGGGLESLTWGGFFVANLIPVTVGNIVGGAIFVGTAYWAVYMRGERKRA